MRYFEDKTKLLLEQDKRIYGNAYYKTRHKFNILRFILGNKRRISPLNIFIDQEKGGAG